MDLSDFDQTQAIAIEDEESDLTDELQPNEVQKPAGYLKVPLQRGLKESVHPVYDGDNIIGRNADSCHICIPSKSLSKEHACIQVINGSHLIFDKGSLNKTHRGKLLLGPDVRYELKNEDEITFADVRCVYLLPKEITDTVAESGSETEDSDNLLLRHEVTLEDSGAASKLNPKTDMTNGNDEDSNEDSVLPPTQVFAEKSERKSVSAVLAEDTPRVFAGRNGDREEATPMQTMVFSESESEEDLVIKKPSGVVEETFYCEDSDPESSKDQEVLGVATQAYFNAECSGDTDEEVLKSDIVGAATQAYATGANTDEDDEEADQDGVIKCAPTVLNDALDEKVEPESLGRDSNKPSRTHTGGSKGNKKETQKFDEPKTTTRSKFSELTATQIFEEDEESNSAENYKLFAMSTLACDSAGAADSESEGENVKGYAGENEPTQVFDVCPPTMKLGQDPGENGNHEMTSSPSAKKKKGQPSHTVKSNSTEFLSPELPTQVLGGVAQEKGADTDADRDKTFDVSDEPTGNLDDAGKDTVKPDEVGEGKKSGEKGDEILDRPTLVLGETVPVISDSENESEAGRRRLRNVQKSNKLPGPVSSSATVVSNKLSTRKGRSRACKATAEDPALSSSDSVSCGEDNVSFEKSLLENQQKSGESEAELDAPSQDLDKPAKETFAPNTKTVEKRGLLLGKQSRAGTVDHNEPSLPTVPSDEPTQAYGIIEAGSTQVYEMDTEVGKETSKVDEPTQAFVDECVKKTSPKSTREDNVDTTVMEVMETQEYEMDSDGDEDVSRVEEPTQAYVDDSVKRISPIKDNAACSKSKGVLETQEYEMDSDGDEDVSRADEPTQAYETDVNATQAFDDEGARGSSKLEDPTQKYDIGVEGDDETPSREDGENHKRSEYSTEFPDESFDDSDLEDQPLLRVNENNLISNTQQLGEEGDTEEVNINKPDTVEPTLAQDSSVREQVSPPRIRNNEEKSEVSDEDSKSEPTSDTEELAADSHPTKIDTSPLNNVLQAQSPLNNVLQAQSPLNNVLQAQSPLKSALVSDKKLSPVTRKRSSAPKHVAFAHVDEASDNATNDDDDDDIKVEEESQTQRALLPLSKKGKKNIRTIASASPTIASASPTIASASPTTASASPTIASASPTRQSPRKLTLEESSQEETNEKSTMKRRGKRGKTKGKVASVEENVNNEYNSLAPKEDSEPVVKKGKKVVSKAALGGDVMTDVRSSRRSQGKPPQRSSPVEASEHDGESSPVEASEHVSEKSEKLEVLTAVKSKDGDKSEANAFIESTAKEQSNAESLEAKEVVEPKRRRPHSEKRTVQKESAVEKVTEMVTVSSAGPRAASRGRRVSFQPAFLKDFETDTKNSNRGKGSAANKNSPEAGGAVKGDDVTSSTDDESVRGKRRTVKAATPAVEPTDDNEPLQTKTGRGRTKRGQPKSTESSAVVKNDADTTRECELDETEMRLGEQEKTVMESKVNEPKTAGTRVKSTRKRVKNSDGDVSGVPVVSSAQNEQRKDSEKLKDKTPEGCTESGGGANNAENSVAVKRARRGQSSVTTAPQATEQDADVEVSAVKPRRKSAPAQKSQTSSSQEADSKASAADIQNSSSEFVHQQVTAKMSTGRGRPRKSEMMKSDSKIDFSTSASETNTVKSESEDKPPLTPTSKRRASGKVEVAETPSKKSYLLSTPTHEKKEGNTEHMGTPTLRKSTMEKKPKVMFTGVIDEQGEKIVRELGGEIASSIHECTHLVTDKIRRTVKFLSGLSKGLPIVSPQWLDNSKRAGTFLDGHKYLVSDQAMEKQFKFVLSTSISKAANNPVFQGFKVHVSKSVHPDPAQMQEILQCAGAKYLKTMPKKMSENTVVVSCADDEELCQLAIKAGIPVVEAEFVLTGILRQEVDLKSYSILTSGNSHSADKRRSKKK